MKPLIAATAAALALVPAGHAVARDLATVMTTKNRSVLLIDRQSVKTLREDGVVLREAVLSIDNSASTGSVSYYAADIKMRADCAAGRLAIISTRTYAPDGTPVAATGRLYPHDFKQPDTPLEQAALGAICEGP